MVLENKVEQKLQSTVFDMTFEAEVRVLMCVCCHPEPEQCVAV